MNDVRTEQCQPPTGSSLLGWLAISVILLAVLSPVGWEFYKDWKEEKELQLKVRILGAMTTRSGWCCSHDGCRKAGSMGWNDEAGKVAQIAEEKDYVLVDGFYHFPAESCHSEYVGKWIFVENPTRHYVEEAWFYLHYDRRSEQDWFSAFTTKWQCEGELKKSKEWKIEGRKPLTNFTKCMKGR